MDKFLRTANLTESDLRGADLRSANLLGATLKDTNFTGANLKNVRLDKSQFCRTKTSVGMMNPNCRD